MTGFEPTNSDPWVDRLSDYLDGEMDADERARLEAHLAGCAECAATLADLGDVMRRARALAPREPATDLWPGIAAGIGAPRADVLPLRLERRETARRLSFSVPQLVAASLVLAIGSAVAGRFLVRAEPDAPVAQGAAPSAVLAAETAPPPGYEEELTRLQL